LRDSFEITVLRVGHRLVRDTRMSTHAALVSRALGASEIIMTGAEEDDTLDSVAKVNKRWGGNFKIRATKDWRAVLKNWRGVKVHLTMYGEELDVALPRIEALLDISPEPKMLLVIGAEKVPRAIFSLSDFNVAVGNQPHSEVAALAVFLDRIYKGRELYYPFERARLRIKPSRDGKVVVKEQLED
jgi:tRNA (cytidine56-2'-O)-methyltransferase